LASVRFLNPPLAAVNMCKIRSWCPIRHSRFSVSSFFFFRSFFSFLTKAGLPVFSSHYDSLGTAQSIPKNPNKKKLIPAIPRSQIWGRGPEFFPEHGGVRPPPGPAGAFSFPRWCPIERVASVTLRDLRIPRNLCRPSKRSPSDERAGIGLVPFSSLSLPALLAFSPPS